MISLASLWLPILLAAVGVFVASSVIHMVIQWHRSEYRQLPNEDEMRRVVRSAHLAPGQYVMPHCPGGKEMKSPEVQQKFAEGPIATLIVRPDGMPKMGPTLIQWFLFALAVAALSALLAGSVLPVGADPAGVFRFFAIVTFMTYVAGGFIEGIWMGRLWSAVARDVVDALIYAAVSAAIFAWLWPR